MSFSGQSVASALLISICLAAVSGCSLRMREPPPAGTSMGLSGADGTCLTGAVDSFKEYFQGRGDADKIAKMCDCASDSLNVFMNRTRGAEAGKYSSRELRDFLERYFLIDHKISDEVLHESMLLKVAFLGGDSLTLTMSELQQIQKIIGLVKSQLLRIRSFLPLTLKQMSEISGHDDFVIEAGQSVISAADELGRALREKGSGYSLERLEALLIALDGSYSDVEIRKIRERMPLIKALKSFVLGPSELMDWSRLLSSGARWYALALRFSHFEANYTSWTSGPGYVVLSDILEEARKLLLEAASVHSQDGIPWAEVEALIDGLRPEELSTSKLKIQPEVLKKLGRQLMFFKATVLTDAKFTLNAEPYSRVISALDIERIFKLVTVLRVQASLLQPYFPLTREWIQSQVGATPEGLAFVNTVTTAVDHAGNAVAEALLQQDSSFLLSDFDALLATLEELLNSDSFQDDREFLHSIRARMSLIYAAKSIVLGTTEKVNWRHFISAGARWYALTLRHAHLEKYPSKESGPGYDVFTGILEESHSLLQNAIASHPSGMIAEAEIDTLIDQLLPGDLKLDGIQLSSQKLKKAVKQLFPLKYALYGTGSGKYRANVKGLFASDLENVFRLIRVLRAQANILSPYPLQTIRKLGPGVEERALVSRVSDLIVASGDEIAKVLDQVGSPYSWSQFESLISTLEDLLKSEKYKGEVESLAWIREHLPLIKALKPVVLAPPAGALHPSDWARLAYAGGRWYGLALRWAYASEQIPTWSWGPGRPWMMELASDGQALLRDTISFHRMSLIPFSSFDTLIDAIHPDDLPVKPATLKNLIRAMAQRTIAGTERGVQGRGAQGLTLGAVDRVWTTIRRWDAGQRFLEGAFRTGTDYKKNDSRDLAKMEISLANLLSMPTRVALDGEDAFTQMVVKDLKQAAKKQPAFFHQDDNEILFGQTSLDMRSFYDLSQLNWIRQVLRMALQGYAGDSKRASQATGVTAQEFKQICDDIRELGIDLKFIDKERYDMHSKRFREANLFLFASDGDAFVSLEEGTQLFQFMLSAKKLSKRMHMALVDRCGAGPMDPFDYPTIQADCYRRNLFVYFEEFFKHMPGAVAHYSSLRGEHRDHFEQAFEEAGRVRGVSDLPGDSTDSEGIAMVAHYVEALLARFDSNASGTLNAEEARVAFDVFKDTFAEYVRPMGLDTDDKVWSLFTYLLAKGVAPSSDISGKLSFVWWHKKGGEDFEADRSRILKIFSEVSKM